MDKEILDQELEGTSAFAKKLLLVLVKFVAPISVAAVLLVSFFYRFFTPNLNDVHPDNIAKTVAEFNAIRNISLTILAVLVILAVIWMIVFKQKRTSV